MGAKNGVPVPCACGCGGTVISPDKWGAKHKWVAGHSWRGRKRPNAVGNQWARREVVGYQAAHIRIRTALGKASEQDCVDCDKQASDWCYKDATGYSSDTNDYTPRCRGCHIRYDRRLSRAAL